MANFLRLQLFMRILICINFCCSGQSLNLQVKDVLLKVGFTQASPCPFLPNPPCKVENNCIRLEFCQQTLVTNAVDSDLLPGLFFF